MIARPINSDAPLKRWCIELPDGGLLQRPADIGGGMWTGANEAECIAEITRLTPAKPAPPAEKFPDPAPAVVKEAGPVEYKAGEGFKPAAKKARK